MGNVWRGSWGASWKTSWGEAKSKSTAVVARGGAGKLTLPFFKPEPDLALRPATLTRLFPSRVSLFLAITSTIETIRDGGLRNFLNDCFDVGQLGDLLRLDQLAHDLADVNAITAALDAAERERLWSVATERAVKRFLPQLRPLSLRCDDEFDEKHRRRGLAALAADVIEYAHAEFHRMTARPVEKAPAEVPTDRELLARANTRERRRQRRMLMH